MNKSGYIKLYRQILDWDFWDDKKATRVFLYILLNANYEDGVFKGHVSVKRGQVLTSLAKLAQGTGHTVKEVRGALRSLVESGEVIVVSTKKFSLISVVKYEEYQGESQGTLTGTQRAQSGAHKGHSAKPCSQGDLLDPGAHKGHTDGHTKGTPEGNNIRSKEDKNKEYTSTGVEKIDMDSPEVISFSKSFVDRWNALAVKHGFTKCKNLSEARLKSIRKRVNSSLCNGKTSEFFKVIDEAVSDAPQISEWLDVTKAGQDQTFTRMAEGYYSKFFKSKGAYNGTNTQGGTGPVRTGQYTPTAKRSVTEAVLDACEQFTDS